MKVELGDKTSTEEIHIKVSPLNNLYGCFNLFIYFCIWNTTTRKQESLVATDIIYGNHSIHLIVKPCKYILAGISIFLKSLEKEHLFFFLLFEADVV